MDSAKVTVGNSKGTDLSGPVFLAGDYSFSQETTSSFTEYCDPGKYSEHCYINVVMHFYMNNHILT